VPESEDQRAIRAVVAEWMAATKRGDSQAVLDLMTDDAVFLVAGQPPMGKAAFMSAVASPPDERPTFDGVSDIKEIYVQGSLAYMWSHLTVTVTPPRSGDSVKRAGHTLTVFRKVDGRWLLARDANLLVKVSGARVT
jgi:uncharacterized protein (TIGR02246 family)